MRLVKFLKSSINTGKIKISKTIRSIKSINSIKIINNIRNIRKKNNNNKNNKNNTNNKKTNPLYSVKFGGNHNVEEFLHGYCNLYLVYFLKKMPEWRGEVMIRKSNKMIIHAYATRIDEDGIKNYADARGIIKDEDEFFKPYSFRNREIIVRDITAKEIAEAVKRIKKEELYAAISELFDFVYGDNTKE